ncbi:hypothetical protein EJ04DRAFT_529092 [Polyplosphaeria fusca]|uniref:Uncharacterized protein n=1 Tax=Polyplosphaeria fusca TaxID=682080 RepID=A0A9P4UX59_9PLEO|nr:hypothetical protein EJ04DRAFT_529092 [Polyplosphaeria fusca]
MDIDKRVPYRLGTSKLAPLPNDWDAVGGPFPPKVQEACAIAKEFLKDEPVSFFYIQRHGEKRNTALILSLYAPALKDKWQKAIEKLYECFKHEEGLVAEIVDYHVHNPLLPKSITMVEVDLHQVVALLNDHEWMTVDIVRWYSPIRQEDWPTVVITARDAGQDYWWSKNIPAVEQFLKDQGLDLEVVLLFLDQLLPELSSNRQDNPYLREAYFLYLRSEIGDSIGIQDMDGSETLGCTVLVEDGREFGVTACQNFRQGPGTTQTGLIGLSIQSPSSYDDHLSKKWLSEDLKAEGWLSEYLKAEDGLSEDLKAEDLHISNLGKITTTSLSGFWLTDWCLFELSPGTCIFMVPESWARIEDGKTYQVKKQGRSTGLREGTISACPSIINSKYIKNAQDAGTVASARCITSKDMAFCLPGDYGASVQENKSGAILGLCVAYNKASKVSYMTPMATVVSEINDAVASKIKEPKETPLE